MNLYPESAVRVVTYLRDKVSRPTTLPKAVKTNKTMLRWEDSHKSPDDEGCCPLGLIYSAKYATPVELGDFYEVLPFSEVELWRFYSWWDSLSEDDAQEAINAIWGELESNDPDWSPEDSDG